MTNAKFFAECARVSRALQRATLAGEIISILRVECEIKRKEIAEAIGASKEKVEALETGKIPTLECYGAIMQLRDIAVILLRTLSPKGVGQWLRAKIRLLKCRPLEALRERRFKDVREAAESYVEGSYA